MAGVLVFPHLLRQLVDPVIPVRDHEQQGHVHVNEEEVRRDAQVVEQFALVIAEMGVCNEGAQLGVVNGGVGEDEISWVAVVE